jgi:hypothetical protein
LPDTAAEAVPAFLSTLVLLLSAAAMDGGEPEPLLLLDGLPFAVVVILLVFPASEATPVVIVLLE